MPTEIIPHEQWERFFEQISRQYADRMASLEMVPEGAGPQLVSFDQPLGGIQTAEQSGRTTITIRLGAEPSALTIETPLRVSTQPFAQGGGQIVEIEAADTPLTRLYLSRSREQSTGRGEIFGGAEPRERAIGQATAASRDRGVDPAGADDMIEGEVGAQAERDLTELLGAHSHGRFDPEDAALQQRLGELIDEEDDEQDASKA